MESRLNLVPKSQKVISMYKTEKSGYEINRWSTAEDYDEQIRRRADLVVNEPVIRDTLEWMDTNRDWLSEESLAKIFHDLKPKIRRIQEERQAAIDQAQLSLCAAQDIAATDERLEEDVRILRHFLRFASLHLSDVLTIDITLATEHLNETIHQLQCVASTKERKTGNDVINFGHSRLSVSKFKQFFKL